MGLQLTVQRGVYTTPNFEDESDVFSFQVDVTEGPLIVVLAWMDLPGESSRVSTSVQQTKACKFLCNNCGPGREVNVASWSSSAEESLVCLHCPVALA
eukprot:1148607-Pelagomonas_calceolata.AAC.17